MVVTGALKPRHGATYALVLLGILIEDKDGLFGRDATGLVELATSGGCFVEIWRVATPSLKPVPAADDFPDKDKRSRRNSATSLSQNKFGILPIVSIVVPFWGYLIGS